MNKLRVRFQIWKQIAPHFQGVKMWYVGDILCEIIMRITIMALPVFYGIFLEKVILGRDIHWLSVVFGGYILLQLVKSAAAIFQKNCQNKVNNRVYRKMRVSALDRYFQMKFEDYAKVSTGEIKMTLEDAVNRLVSFQTQFYQYCIHSVFIVIVIAALVGINWRLAIAALLSIPVTFILDHLVSRSEKGVNQIINENNVSWTTWVDETIKGWKEVRINQCEEKRKQEFADFQTTDETWFTIWLRYWTTRVMAIPKMKDDFIMQFLLYFTGGILIYYKYMTIGMLLVFVQYYGMLSDSVKAVSTSDAELQSEMAHYERILKHLDGNGNIFPEGTLLPERYDLSFGASCEISVTDFP